jgi:hypothetical protein
MPLETLPLERAFPCVFSRDSGKERAMHRRALILGAIASSYVTVSRADSWSLITDDEFAKEKSAPQIETAPPSPTRTLGSPPTITVEQPDTTKPIKSPVTIRASFHPHGGAAIVVTSLRVTYGSLGIDITGRIIAHAKLSASGISADNAQLPSGHHKIAVQIADDKGSIGTQNFEFTIV